MYTQVLIKFNNCINSNICVSVCSITAETVGRFSATVAQTTNFLCLRRQNQCECVTPAMRSCCRDAHPILRDRQFPRIASDTDAPFFYFFYFAANWDRTWLITNVKAMCLASMQVCKGHSLSVHHHRCIWPEKVCQKWTCPSGLGWRHSQKTLEMIFSTHLL